MSSQVRECVVFVDTVLTVPVLSKPTGDEQLMLSNAVCLVQVAISTSSACCRCSFPCYQLILCTRLCVHDSRHAAHNGSRKPHMSISSHKICQCQEDISRGEAAWFSWRTARARPDRERESRVSSLPSLTHWSRPSASGAKCICFVNMLELLILLLNKIRLCNYANVQTSSQA